MSGDPIKNVVLALLHEARAQEEALLGRLPAAAREAEGTPEDRSPKDVVAHLALWKRLQTGKLEAAMRGEPLPVWTDGPLVDKLDADNFQLWQHRSWQDVHADAERAYLGLVAQVERMSEADLTAERQTGGEALWPETLGNGTWHPYSQLYDLCRRRGDTAGAAGIRAAERAGYETVLQVLRATGTSPEMRANIAFNLACLYARDSYVDQAIALLAEAFPLRPGLMEWARHDSDLDGLRALPAYQALYEGVNMEARNTRMSRDTVRDRLSGAAPPVVIDVRDPSEYAAGHVRGATNIPLGTLSDQLAELPRDRTVITYCNMHNPGISRGEQAAELLRREGRQAWALDGGYPGWRDAGLPVEAPDKAS